MKNKIQNSLFQKHFHFNIDEISVKLQDILFKTDPEISKYLLNYFRDEEI
jgi:hypothetical protein